MGENKHIEELDAFAKKYVKEIAQEKPSIDFTASILDKIALEKSQKSVFKTKALISKKSWFAIFTLLLAIVLLSNKYSEKSVLEFPEVDFSFLDKIQIPNLFESLTISNSVLISVFLFGLMFIAQVVFLKKHFDKRFD
ncbi:hypothetical protein [Polaribacter septentrionalilitoris]|uniref:hypothetical protein n=1 Tax=Polaribacter septentrionalilitoris TaxID=2494657 RepID=UPI00135AA66B|nr:hypothetical protein [Polaribacter septentrionalilitoris]